MFVCCVCGHYILLFCLPPVVLLVCVCVCVCVGGGVCMCVYVYVFVCCVFGHYILLFRLPLVQPGVVWVPTEMEHNPLERIPTGRSLQCHLEPGSHPVWQVSTLSSLGCGLFSTVCVSRQNAYLFMIRRGCQESSSLYALIPQPHLPFTNLPAPSHLRKKKKEERKEKEKEKKKEKEKEREKRNKTNKQTNKHKYKQTKQ